MNPVVQATNNIRGGLTVLQVFSGLYLLLGAAVIVLGLIGGATLLTPQVESINGSVVALLVVLVGLLCIATGLIYIVVMAWIKDWQRRMVEWTGGTRPDLARLEALTTTLGRWILASQWVPVVTLGLILVLVITGGALLGAALGSFAGLGGEVGTLLNGSNTEGGLEALLGAGAVSGILVVVLLGFYSPFLVLNWLILGSIGRWMRGVAERALGRPSTVPNLLTLSNTVSGWLTFSQVIVGLTALLQLLSGINPSGGGSSGNALFASLFVLLIDGLLIMLLQWSKTFLFGVAGYAERYGGGSSGGSEISLSK